MQGVVEHCARNDENAASIGSNGGIADVITAMQNHSAIAAVQEVSCGALASLAVNCAENKRRIADGGGITAVPVCDAESPCGAAAVQEQACIALWSIAFDGIAENAVIDWVERRYRRCDHGDADSRGYCSGAGK